MAPKLGAPSPDSSPAFEPVPFRVGTKCPDDPVYLPARAQFGDLPEAQERAVRVAAFLPDGLDERKVLVGLVATATNRPLHEHNHILQHCQSDAVDMSPLHSRSKVWTYPQLAQVRGLRGVPRTKVAPKSGPRATGFGLTRCACVRVHEAEAFPCPLDMTAAASLPL